MFATLVKATLVSLAVQGALAEFRLDTPTELVQVCTASLGGAWVSLGGCGADLCSFFPVLVGLFSWGSIVPTCQVDLGEH